MSEFDQLYATLEPKLDALEKIRRKTQSKKMQTLLVCVLLAIGVVIGVMAMLRSGSTIVALVLAVGGFFGLNYFYQLTVGSALRQFRYLYKQEVIKGIASAIDPGLTYEPNEGISQQHFKDVGHYSNRIDRYKTEDFFQGKLDSTHLYFAEIHAEYKTTTSDSNGRTKTTWHTLFKGVFFAADFHKSFNTWVTIRPDKESGLFGWIGKKLEKFSSSRIRMENPEFEEHFKVNAGDDQEARYLLTPDMQERLLKLQRSYGKGVIISFQNERVFITIPNKSDYFEGSIHKSVHSKEQIRVIADQIMYFLYIVEALNLNTRIWTKE